MYECTYIHIYPMINMIPNVSYDGYLAAYNFCPLKERFTKRHILFNSKSINLAMKYHFLVLLFSIIDTWHSWVFCIWQNFQGGKLSWLEGKIVIQGKTFTAAYLYTHSTNQHSHKFMRKFSWYRVNNWENHVYIYISFPFESFAIYSIIY